MTARFIAGLAGSTAFAPAAAVVVALGGLVVAPSPLLSLSDPPQPIAPRHADAIRAAIAVVRARTATDAFRLSAVIPFLLRGAPSAMP
jgi:hypothetical protein